jgi:hypothetical protein
MPSRHICLSRETAFLQFVACSLSAMNGNADTLGETGPCPWSQHLCLEVERPGIGARGQLRQIFQIDFHV